MNPFAQLSDAALHDSLKTLAKGERESSVDIILHLMVIKERKLYATLSYSSVFDYCTKALGFSRATAYRRKTVMERAGEFPDLLSRLRDGRLQLCAAACIAPHLTEANAVELMDAAVGLSHREVETMLLKRTKLTTTLKSELIPLQILSLSAETVLAPQQKTPAPTTAHSPALAIAAVPSPRTIIKPLTAESSRVSITLTEATIDCLRRAKELVRCGSDDELLQRALQLLIAKNDPNERSARRATRAATKGAATATPAKRPAPDTAKCNRSSAKRPPRRGHQKDRDDAFMRAGGQCEYRSPGGVRCESRRFLEVDHIDSVAFGGQSVVGNYQMLCTTHHHIKTEQTFGTRPRRKVNEANGTSRDAAYA